jgi:hypothetical protein
MEDKESLSLLVRMWGKRVYFCQKTPIGNGVWRIYVHGQKAYDLLKIVLPYIAGEKRKKSLYLLRKYRNRTSLPVSDPKIFEPVGGV